MAVEGSTGTVDCCRKSTRVRLLSYPCPPRDGRQPNVSSRRVRVMELLHPRWAGIDISKRDAKVCVRIAGSGRRRAAETVTTWSSMTNQVLALRDHLTRERVTCVVLEAASDYWETVLLPVGGRQFRGHAGQSTACEKPPRSQRCLRCCLAGTARRPRPGAGLVRATRADPPFAGSDPNPERDHPRTRPGGPTPRKAARGQRDQTVLSGQRNNGGVGAGDAGRAHRRATRPSTAGGASQAPAPVQDPGADGR